MEGSEGHRESKKDKGKRKKKEEPQINADGRREKINNQLN